MYRLAPSATGAVVMLDGACIPADPANADYQAYLRWTAAGNAATPLPAAAPSSQMSPLAFMARFTAVEQAAIAAAAQSNAAMLLWLVQMAGAAFIDLVDPRTKQGVNALVSVGLLSAARGAEILMP